MANESSFKWVTCTDNEELYYLPICKSSTWSSICKSLIICLNASKLNYGLSPTLVPIFILYRCNTSSRTKPNFFRYISHFSLYYLSQRQVFGFYNDISSAFSSNSLSTAALYGMLSLGSSLNLRAAAFTIKLQNWCLTHPAVGANSLKLCLSDVTVSLNMIAGHSFGKCGLKKSSWVKTLINPFSDIQNTSLMLC